MKPVLASVSYNGEDELQILLRHTWSIREIREIRHMLSDISFESIRRVVVDGKDLESIDISTAWMLIGFARKLRGRDIEVTPQNFGEHNKRVFAIVGHIEHPGYTAPTCANPVFSFFTHVGKAATLAFASLIDLQVFFGRLCVTVATAVLKPWRLKFRSIVFHVNETGIKAIPIVSLLAILISIVLGYQGALQLGKFGANILTIDLVSISLLREMGVLVTAIIVAGRSGSAFAAQLGVMQVNQEIDALRTFGLDPFELLVLPRIIGLIIALPILTFIADVVGLFGTLIVSTLQLHIGHAQFMGRLHEAVNVHTFMIGLVKAPVFALLIGMAGCRQGMDVRESAEEVGMHTTAAVVESIFLVILFDAAFSILFTWMGV